MTTKAQARRAMRNEALCLDKIANGSFTEPRHSAPKVAKAKRPTPALYGNPLISMVQRLRLRSDR